MTERCGDCRFWADWQGYPVRDEGLDWQNGVCRRHAPSPELRITTEQRYDNKRQWPNTLGREWCGDFERRSEPAPSAGAVAGAGE